METRINLFEKGQKALGSLYGVGSYLAVTTINTYNRINIAFRPLVGTYQPGQFDKQTV